MLKRKLTANVTKLVMTVYVLEDDFVDLEDELRSFCFLESSVPTCGVSFKAKIIKPGDRAWRATEFAHHLEPKK